jgi:hypothetical protein
MNVCSDFAEYRPAALLPVAALCSIAMLSGELVAQPGEQGMLGVLTP